MEKYQDVIGWVISYYDANSFSTGEREEFPDSTLQQVMDEILRRSDSDGYQLEISPLSNPTDPIVWWDGNGFQEL